MLLYKAINELLKKNSLIFSNLYCKFVFWGNGVTYKNIICFGYPYIHVSMDAKCIIGENFKINNGAKFSDAGINGKCRIEVRDKAILTIGNNVGISDVTITCHENITIGNNVIIGVGTQIRDTDNHSLNSADWLNGLDWKNKKTKSIEIFDNVFIGSNCIILKGVVIGKNSVVAAGSVVTKNIPSNEIWGGNPSSFIKNK